jgi:HEAT repeat protein
VALARHPDAAMRTKAIVLLARSTTDAATGAVVDAIGDANESVQRVALAAIGKQADPIAVAAVGRLLANHENWAVRVLAAQAMGRLGAGRGREATEHLEQAATHDSYALVREASLVALAAFDPARARDLATKIAASDAEPRVRDTATQIATKAR